MKPNHLEQIGTFLINTFTMALILFVLSAALPDTVEARLIKVAGQSGCSAITDKKMRDDCFGCTMFGGTFEYESDGSSFTCTNSDDEVLVCNITSTGRYDFCFTAYSDGRVVRKTPGGNKPVGIRVVPLQRFPPWFRSRIRAAEIRKNKLRKASPRRKLGTGQPRAVKKSGQTQKQKGAAITKPTRPGVPMPTKPIRPGTPMKK